MPVPIETLQQAERPLDDRIVEFLQREPAQAFQLEEIAVGVSGLAPGWAPVLALILLSSQPISMNRPSPFIDAMTRLVAAGRVRSWDYKDAKYFSVLP